MLRGLTGGIGGSFVSSSTTVATATVASDGSFAARVPDFLGDPAVAAHPGRFTLFFLTGPSSHPLALAGQGTAGPGLDLARAYEPIALRLLPGRRPLGATRSAARH
jgi:hypothetical protein